MRDDGIGLPLSRRVPGAARPGPGQSVQAAMPEDLLTRMQAAVDAEHAQADVHNHGEPNTEPLPCVTESGATTKAARRPASQTGIGPGIEAPPDQVAESAFAVPPPLEELPLRVAKALRAARVAEDLGADESELVRAAEPEAVQAAEPQPVQAAEPEPVWAAESQRQGEAAYPPPAEPPRRTRPAAAAYDDQPSPGSIGWLWHEETTTARGSSSRWQPRAGRGGGSGHRTTALAVLGAVVLGAAGLIIGLSLHSAPGEANGNSAAKTSAKPATTAPNSVTSNPAGVLPGGPPVAANRAAAVAWLAGEVAAATVVACDASTCATLTANGFPPGQEVHLGLDSQTLSNAGVVIVTPQVRLLLGTVRPRLGSDVVPAVLASFGSGAGQVTIQVVDPSGASAYEAALSQDVQERMQLGNKLLDSGSITASPAGPCWRTGRPRRPAPVRSGQGNQQ